MGPESVLIDKGVLQVVDNQVDQTTGTVKLKAEFPNAALKLWPGAFVNTRLLVETLQGAITVPGSAVQRGPKGTFVYVVKDDAVAMRPVVMNFQDDAQAVVASGVAEGEIVVTTGFGQLSDGAKVAVVAPAGETPAAPAAEVQRPRRDGGGQGQGGGGRNRQKPAGEAGATPPAPTPAAPPT